MIINDTLKTDIYSIGICDHCRQVSTNFDNVRQTGIWNKYKIDIKLVGTSGKLFGTSGKVWELSGNIQISSGN